jgi:hypothetical protein
MLIAPSFVAGVSPAFESDEVAKLGEPETGRSEKQGKHKYKMMIFLIFWPGLESLAFLPFRRTLGGSGVGFGRFRGFWTVFIRFCVFFSHKF